jgi:hypothetical protein
MRITMSAWLRVLVFVLLVCSLPVGCSREQSETTEAPTPSDHRPSTTFRDPLTEQELQTFLTVLETLPGKQAPEFEPLSQSAASNRYSAAQLVEVYRHEYRAMFDASRHGARWRKDDGLMATFTRHDVTPEDFAALMVRMSCAITAAAIDPQTDLHGLSANADDQVARLVETISRLDAAPRTQDVIEHRREALDALQNFVAFSEFTRLLQDVPSASRELVARHRSRLAGHLPQAGSIEALERAINSQIVPAGFEESPASDPYQ